jgi:tRNA threonylcarbamoyladenosine biosynthesis protein TsaB
MATILHIETSTKMCSVALSEKGQYVGHKNYQDDDGYAHSEKLTVLIAELLNETNLSLAQLNAISVSGGPGSYTGLRIGASTAKGLCYALGIPLIAIDSLSCLNHWAQAHFPEHKGLFLSLIDARRMEVYSLLCDNQLHQLKPISADVLVEDSYAELCEGQEVILSGDGAEKTQALWAHRKNFIYSNLLADARGQQMAAFLNYSVGKFEDVAYYEPFYLKDFIAGIKKG